MKPDGGAEAVRGVGVDTAGAREAPGEADDHRRQAEAARARDDVRPWCRDTGVGRDEARRERAAEGEREQRERLCEGVAQPEDAVLQLVVAALHAKALSREGGRGS